MFTKAKKLYFLCFQTWFPQTEFSFAGTDNDYGDLNEEEVTYDEYVPLNDEGPATGMYEFTVMGLIGGIVLVLALLSFCAWLKSKFALQCCFAVKFGD